MGVRTNDPKKGSGVHLVDDTETAYLDTRNNVAHCGHCHPRVVAAIQRQVATVQTNTRYLHPVVCELAQRLVATFATARPLDLSSSCHTDDTPTTNPTPTIRNESRALDTVFFCNSGSEANDLALRLARAWSGGSNNTIVVDGAYHGHTLATLEISPYKYETSQEYTRVLQPQPIVPSTIQNTPAQTVSIPGTAAAPVLTPGRHIWKVPCPDVWRGPYRDPTTAGALYAAHVEDACRYYRDELGENVRAFIVEGGLSVAGVVLPPKGYLRACADSVRAAGGLYIADEVQTGLGRLGSCFWAFEYQEESDCSTDDSDDNVVPDIVTIGKPFGNGMPLAAVVTSRAVAQVFESCNVEYFNTFGGNPVSAAAGLAVLNVLRDEKLQENARNVGSYMIQRFRELHRTIGWIGCVRGSGFFLGVELVTDWDSRSPATAVTSWLCSQLKVEYHILTSIDGPHNNVLVIKPPMVFSQIDANYLIDSMERALTIDLPPVLSTLNETTKTPT